MFETDRPLRHKTRSPSGTRWEDEARFIRTWLENPKATGAVSPSGRALSRAMARYVDPAASGPVIELGPGTGPVTEALIRRGVPQHRLVLVEYDATFCKLLARRYPNCTIIQGDAYALGRTLEGLLDEPAAAIVSSLPLLNQPDRERLRLLREAFELLGPHAPFVQFTYGLLSPMPRHGTASSAWFDAMRLGTELREQRARLRAEIRARSRKMRIELDAPHRQPGPEFVDEDFIIGSQWGRPMGPIPVRKDQ